MDQTRKCKQTDRSIMIHQYDSTKIINLLQRNVYNNTVFLKSVHSLCVTFKYEIFVYVLILKFSELLDFNNLFKLHIKYNFLRV